MFITQKYYAVFTKDNETVKVEFPDFDGCHAYGFDLADAYNMAFEQLYYHIPTIRPEQIKSPSSYDDIKARFPRENQVILPFVVDMKEPAIQ
jgi:predicted RNase H-like HicB family nuclease